MSLEETDPEHDHFSWEVAVHTRSPSTYECGARPYWAELLVEDDNSSLVRSCGRAHFVVVPFGGSGAAFLDTADEVSSEVMAAAEFAVADMELISAAGMVFVQSVELDEDVRGARLGTFLLVQAVRALADFALDAVVVLEPAPFDADSLPTPVRARAMESLAKHWASIGFEFDENRRFMSVRVHEFADVDRFPPVRPELIHQVRASPAH